MRFNIFSKLISILLLSSMTLFAQLQKSGFKPEKVEYAKEFETDNKGSLVYLKLSDEFSKLSIDELPQILAKSYNIKTNFELKKTNEYIIDETKVQKVVQSINEYEVEGGDLSIVRNSQDEIIAIAGTLRQIVDENPKPIITEEQALNYAKDFLGAQKYAWQDPEAEAFIKLAKEDPNATYYPKAALVYAPINGEFENEYKLCYKFEIHTLGEKPGRYFVFVDAKDGSIVNSYNKINTVAAVGTGYSLYSGTVSINTDNVNNVYYMRDMTRPVETYDMKNGTSYTSAVLFSDSDNIWNSSSQKAGVDAHYGAAKTYDYFKTKFNRNSFDGNGAKIKSYVHYSSNYNNAYWNGSVMTFGDGDGSTFTPLVTIDVIAHEFTHAVTERTANLAYQYESGALNEAISDIFGASVEFYAYGSNGNWLIGEQCYTPNKSGDALRYMNNPNLGQQPDTYQGTYWYSGTGDNGGVHYNSGVPNYWYYLLCVGGNGTNDKGYNFSVSGIGIDKAANIVYRALTVYMTSSTNFAAARTATLNAAKDLYGATSNEYTQVGKAWDAVGVYGSTNPPGGGGSFTEVNEVEPNGSTSEANSLSVAPIAVTGKISSTTDNDYFKIYVPAGKKMTFTLKVPSGKDYDLYVYNSSGSLVAKSENGTGATENITITNSGTSQALAYVRVKGYNGSYSTTATYRLEITIPASFTELVENNPSEQVIDKKFELLGNYPNPFNPSTTISFYVSEPSFITIDLYNSIGEKVGEIFRGEVKSGVNSVMFNAKDLASGAYFYRISLGNEAKYGKMLLTK